MVQNLGDNIELQKSLEYFDISISKQVGMQKNMPVILLRNNFKFSKVSEIVDRKT